MPKPQVERGKLSGCNALNVTYEGFKKTLLILDSKYRLKDGARDTFINLCHRLCEIERKSYRFIYVELDAEPKKKINKIIQDTGATGVVIIDEVLTKQLVIGDVSKSFGHITKIDGVPYISTVPFRYWSDEEYKKSAVGPNLLGFTLRHMLMALRGAPLYTEIDYSNYKLINVNTIDKFNRMMDSLWESRLIAIDTEGDSLYTISSKLFCVQFGIKRNNQYLCYFLPFEHRDTPWTGKELKYIKKELAEFFEGHDGEHVYHTAQHDIAQFKTHTGIKFYSPDVYDVSQAEYLLDENAKFMRGVYGIQKPFSLETIEARYNIVRPKQTISKDDRKDMAKFSLEEIFDYASWDVLTLLVIRKYQRELCTHPLHGHKSLTRFNTCCIHQLGATVKTFAIMKHNGMALDVGHVVAMSRDDGVFGKAIEQIYDKLMMTPEAQKANRIILKRRGASGTGIFGKKVEKRVLDLSKAEHRQVLYFDVMKLEPLKTGSTGIHSTDKNFQKAYAGRYPPVALLQDLNKNAKLKNAFADSLAKKIVEDRDFLMDGRIRPSFGNLMVLTGRLACLTGDTLVTMSDGTEKRIINVRPNDLVRSYNPNTKQFENKLVERVLEQGMHETYVVKYWNTKRGFLREITCTSDHQFAVVGKGWIAAKDLKRDMALLCENGAYGKVKCARHTDRFDFTYDLTIADNNNFIANGALVHNCYDPNTQQIPSRGPLSTTIKKAFIAGINPRNKKRRVIIASDFAAHEIRMSGVLAVDKVILDTFKIAAEHIRQYRLGPEPKDLKTAIAELDKKIDVHLANVKRFYGVIVDKSHQLRELVKSVVFSSIYGATALKIARETQATEIQGAIDGKYLIAKLQGELRGTNADPAKFKNGDYEKLLKEWDPTKDEGVYALDAFLRKKLKAFEEIIDRDDEYYITQAEEAFDRLKSTWHELFDWMDTTQKNAASTLLVHYPNHRIRHLYGYLSSDIWVHRAMDRRATNSPVQGVSSDISTISIYTAAEWCYRNCWSKGIPFDYNAMNVVHDANYNDVQFEHMPLGIYLIEHAMSTLPTQYFRKHFNWDLGVPLGYDIDVGLDWADTKEWRKRPEQLYSMIDDIGAKIGVKTKNIQADARLIMDVRMRELEKGIFTPMLLRGDKFQDFARKLHMFDE